MEAAPVRLRSSSRRASDWQGQSGVSSALIPASAQARLVRQTCGCRHPAGSGDEGGEAAGVNRWIDDNLSLDEANMLLQAGALLLALLVVMVPPVRRAIGRALDRVLILSGNTRRRYARWFLKEHGTLRNIYLGRTEELDLASTYVPLTVSGGARSERSLAAQVLSQADNRHIVILGEPGSGKSTLLAAFGTALLQRGFRPEGAEVRIDRRAREVPVLVVLRQFSHALSDDPTLTFERYLIERLFREGAGLKRASGFFQRLVRRQRLLLLLDGLDEVRETAYPGVRDKLLRFVAQYEIADNRALRIVLTCRAQNYLALRDDWVPRFASEEHTLCPLRDDEVRRFLYRRHADYRGDRSPEAFYASIERSGTMELHRVPLILTVSLGMYLMLTAYEIPRSLADFYEEMIKELLRRHDFRLDITVGSHNRFPTADKYRFLRQFALDMAVRDGQFDEFTFAELLIGATAAAQRMANLSGEEVRPFLAEIIDHAGLLTRTSDDDTYIFAHRSIHEYFAADQLARSPSTAHQVLLDHATDPLWRQVAMFYCALDPEGVDSLVAELADINLELAGHCAAANIDLPMELTKKLVDRSVAAAKRDDSVALSALVAMGYAPTSAARALARNAVVDVLSTTELEGTARPHLFAGLDEAYIFQLIDQLAAVRSGPAARLVITLSRLVADSPRLVSPLWTALEVSLDPFQRGDLAIATARLLTLVQDPASLVALNSLPPLRPTTGAVRLTMGLRDVRDVVPSAHVYPFRYGHPADSNLVLLLKLGVAYAVPVQRSKYFDARRLDPVAFARLEADHQRRLKVIRPYWLGAGLFLLGYLGLPLLAGWRVLIDDVLWSPERGALPAEVTVPMLVGGLVLIGSRFWPGLRLAEFIERDDRFLPSVRQRPDVFSPFAYLTALCWRFGEKNPVERSRMAFMVTVLGFVLATPLTVAVDLTTDSTLMRILLMAVVSLFCVWLPVTKMCEKSTKIYRRRPNPFLHLYEDPETKHWLVAPGEGGRPVDRVGD